MKIAIDISQVVYDTGVSHYTRNLVKSLLEIDNVNNYLLLGGSFRQKKKIIDFFTSLKKHSFERKLIPFPPSLADIIWNRLHILPIEAITGKIDVFHSSDWSQPPASAFKVTTVHDLVPLIYPQLSHPKVVSAHKARFNWLKSEVDAIIVPSEATEVDLVNFGIKADKIAVIPEAPDPIFKHESKARIEEVKKKYRIVGKYLLAVGITPRKNTERIIEAYAEIRKEMDIDLVIIGHSYINVEAEQGIILPGLVDFEDIPALYSGAQALVYPSLFEGYGLPILEAFACKTPVVTSNQGSLKEVAQDAAILVNPTSVKSIIFGINEALVEKENIIAKGVKRVKMFNWVKTAEMTLNIYKKAEQFNK